MNILLLGSGGREHALAWKLRQSPLCNKLYIAPGNAGTTQHGENVDISVTDFEGQKSFCTVNNIHVIVVGPEEPLVRGIYDYFKKELRGSIVIGPSAAAAQLEGSKAFSKHFMQRHDIPTAAYAEFDEATFEEGLKYLEHHSLPIVLKADGLAAGKGVVICDTVDEAKTEFTAMLKEKKFGNASAKVVVEQFLKGIELSVFVVTDGLHYKIIGHAKDYKRIGEGDTGLNTGGMGAVSPVPFADEAFMQKIEQKVIVPTIQGIREEKLDYKGFIFFGLMKVADEPYVIEYNCRMGDPETEVIIPRLKNDLVELLLATAKETLNEQEIEFDDRSCCTIVAVSGGYPGDYKKNFEISRLENSEVDDNVLVFHSGTKQAGDKILTNGGRVLAVTSFGNTISGAASNSITALEKIHFENLYYRRDIGYEWRSSSL